MTHWYETPAVDGDAETVVDEIDGLEGDTPRPLPRLAVEAGAFPHRDAYYDRLHDVTVALAEHRVASEAGTPEQDLIHGVRALDALREVVDALGETAEDWRPDAGERGAPVLDGLASERDDVEARRDEVEAMVEDTATEVAPTLSAIAGPILAARLVELAGGMEELARMPSGTIQVLGAEDALFRHLTDGTPPPKHGAIYLHPAVRGAPPDERGRIARSLSGKLAIAARVDHYRGELDETVVADWERIRDALEAE